MNFCFFSARTFESWNWRTPLEIGIGGSETSHVEMAQRLARRGHDVLSFAPCGEETEIGEKVPLWFDSATFSSRVIAPDSICVIYRDPAAVAEVPEGAVAWLICQDVDYQMTPEQSSRFSRIVALCSDHAEYLKRAHPEAAEKVCISSNGIRSDLIRATMQNPPARNPRRLMYASSPDRGLWSLLDIFARVREVIPDAELHVFYGFNNLEKCPERVGPLSMHAELIRFNTARLLEALKAPGVIHHGRINQRDLITEWMKSGIWAHPSEFSETSCITCMDAQACGAIPVTTPIWAIWQNVQYGVMVEGMPQTDRLTQARYVLELIRLIQDTERQEKLRAQMIPWALRTFNWDVFVDQWEIWATEDLRRLALGRAA